MNILQLLCACAYGHMGFLQISMQHMHDTCAHGRMGNDRTNQPF